MAPKPSLAFRLRRRLPFVVSFLLRLPNGLVFFRRNRRFAGRSLGDIFDEIYRNNLWGHPESRSGFGSTLQATERLRRALPALLGEIGARSLLDIPCGDFNWMRAVEAPLERYIGADIVADLVEENRRRHGAPGREFMRLDIVADPLPTVDLVVCRDLFIHFPDSYVFAALANIKASGSRYLLATTFARARANRDIPLGSVRPINLERPPFSLPPPLRLVEDGDEARGLGRGLGLWRIANIPG